MVVRDFDRARKRATALDRNKGKGPGGPMHGVPMTIKESFDIAGLPTTWGIPALKGHKAKANSIAVERYLAAGAVFDNLDELDLNVVGPMARSAADLALGLDIMAGSAPEEAAWQLRLPAPRAKGLKGLPFGVQILGGMYEDRTTIAVAGMLEKAWRGFTPPPGWE